MVGKPMCRLAPGPSLFLHDRRVQSNKVRCYEAKLCLRFASTAKQFQMCNFKVHGSQLRADKMSPGSLLDVDACSCQSIKLAIVSKRSVSFLRHVSRPSRSPTITLRLERLVGLGYLRSHTRARPTSLSRANASCRRGPATCSRGDGSRMCQREKGMS